jgi:hypothetical protein
MRPPEPRDPHGSCIWSVRSGGPYDKILNEVWVAPISTSPVATPFEVTDAADGSLAGAGAILSHVVT